MTMDHAAIRVSNLDDSLAFYRDVFGYEPVDRFEESDSVSDTFVGVDDQAVIQLIDADGPVEADDGGHLGLSVEDIDAAVAELPTDRVTRGPETIDDIGVRIAFVTDPDGHVLELLEPV
ncbi:VOC family protein [Haloarchaeobius litoreus]|uniref:VOC family protein n=1 Tax=Haloarchaeobius litoreus TaxID=755306 RepID=A0ABD6DGP8_9EURY|nr:VOC family protein [Haloarchaeobius litoreus]